jgi:PAS domain S-box-containing protein
MLKRPRPAALRYAFVIAAVGVALLLRLILGPLLGSDLRFLFLWPAVTWCAWYGGLGPGLLATILSALAGRYFLLEPVHSLAPVTPADGIGMLLYLLLGTFISLVIEGLHRAKRQVEQQAAALDEQRERFRVTLASIGDAVIATDTDGRITFINLIGEQLTGWTSDDARLRPLETVLRIVNERTRNVIENPVQRVLQSSGIVGLENHTILLRKDGAELPIDDSAAPIRDTNGKMQGVVLVFRDVTERRRLENEVEQRSKQLIVADERKNEFLSVLAHEFRNLLAPMLNGIEFVRHFCGAEPRVEKTVDVMDRQVQVMAGLVEDLMDSARISQGKVSLRRERIELVRTVKQAVETSRLLIDVRQQSFTLHAADEPIWLDADPARLIQIVVNLLNNAAKYTPEGGRICLSIEQEPGHGIVRVRDSGMGIQREMLTRVFDLYTQSEQAENDSRGGLGIGLSLVRGFVELHGGTVDVFSEGIGKGSEFVVRLPLSLNNDSRQSTVPNQVEAVH